MGWSKSVLAALLAGCAFAHAQVPPDKDEAARYSGLHAAAHRGDVATIQKLASQRKNLEARDAHGRTPLHVATFARQREAIRALAAAGVDLHRLENDRYDCVTIAAVADDEETLRILLELGANLRLADRQGRTPLELARGRGYAEMVRMLEGR